MDAESNEGVLQAGSFKEVLSVSIPALIVALSPPHKYADCELCPARTQPFSERLKWRWFNFRLTILVLPLQRQLRWLYRFLELLGLIAALSLDAFYLIIPEPESFMRKFLSFVTVLLLIGAPSYMIIREPQDFNVTAQILFSLLLFAATIWLSGEANNEKAKKEASARWLPAAESAYKQLTTISHNVSRMRANQKEACSKIDPLIPAALAEQCKGLKHMFDLQCRETGQNLESIKNQLDTAVADWDMFIQANCAKDECGAIDLRIKKHLAKLVETEEGESTTGS